MLFHTHKTGQTQTCEARTTVERRCAITTCGIGMCIDMCITTHIDICVDTHMDTYTDMCIDMHLDMGVDMHVDMCIGKRIGMWKGRCRVVRSQCVFTLVWTCACICAGGMNLLHTHAFLCVRAHAWRVDACWIPSSLRPQAHASTHVWTHAPAHVQLSCPA